MLLKILPLATFLFLIFPIATSKSEIQAANRNFITIVNPVRSRELWLNKSIDSLTNQLEAIEQRNLPATWLLTYDILSDHEVIDVFKSKKTNVEIGAFLEVSENWATDAKVQYKVSDGDYYRPDKVFLSGYSPSDRQKLIKAYLTKFSQVIGNTPESVGAWYIDANSQYFLSQKGVGIAITVADQFDTDAESVWGKYFSMPYYPSKYNSLEPAKKEKEKIPIVNLQWAQRDPVLGYGKEVKDSRQSFQANDYVNNGYDFNYFENLLDIYLKNKRTDFNQISIGLETGQEAVTFASEFEKQLEKIKTIEENGTVSVVTMRQFAQWYKNRYPNVSPDHFLEKEESFWYMSPHFRLGFFKEGNDYKIKDFRAYHNQPFRDYYYSDENHYLDRKVPSIIDSLIFTNQINLGAVSNIQISQNFDQIIIKMDNRVVTVSGKGINLNGAYLTKPNLENNSMKRIKTLNLIVLPRSLLINFLKIFKYSKIGGSSFLGLGLPANQLVGLKAYAPGIYRFDFQTFSRFRTPASFIDKWQPWIN